MVTSYGGDLFKAGDLSGDAIERSLALIEEKAEPPTDEVVYRMLVLLTRTTERVREGAAFRLVAAPVDFTELTSEYIGILYEGLLDYELHRAGNEPIVFLGLGDQPALPLDRLEAMPDKQLSALVEKAKVKKSDKAKADSDESDDEEADAEEEADVEDDAPEAEEVPVLDDIEPDDARSAALKRAMAWAERAAIAGKLVKAPKGKKGATDQAWKAELERTSRQLIAAVKLPGELYLVRWGGTRKGAGTFYTRPQLTLPTVRRTLEPLIFDEGGRTCPPEALLALKICDPAMGSGSFLVAALRVLTEAVVRSLHEHGRIVRGGDLIRIECDLLPDADRDQPEDRVESIVRRAVVEHCLYGVDLDPLAVELARVSLWVETLDRRLPFTFLDHKLRCGNALVGTWLDRFRDYPLLAWWRQSPDEKWKGVHHPADLWANALKEKRKVVVAEQVDLLTGQRNLLSAGVSDAELTAAIARVRELYRKLRRVPSTQPDKRAEIWRTKVAPDPAIARVREAFDTWCALWFWPPDKLDDAPTPMTLLAPSETSRAIVREVRMRQRFLHWELEFPDVFTENGAGFDAIVGNPPWETVQAQSKEFFSDIDPLYRLYGKQQALSQQRVIFEQDFRVEESWLASLAAIRNLVNYARHVGDPYGSDTDDTGRNTVSLSSRKVKESQLLHQRWTAQRRKRIGLSDPEHAFRLQGDGKPYSYKLFIEQGHALLKQGGQLGLIVPGGVYTDKGTIELRRLLLERCDWQWLYGYENRKIFDIHSSFKFAVCIARKGGTTTCIRVAFMRTDIDDWSNALGSLECRAETIRAFSPRNLSFLEIGAARDVDVLTNIYRSGLLLGEPVPIGWGATFGREFNITDDSKLFPRVEVWESEGYQPAPYGQWRFGDGVAVPVYQGAMIHQFDFSASRFDGGSGHGIQWQSHGWSEKRVAPQFLMSLQNVAVAATGLRLLFRKIGNPTNARTMLASMAPSFPAVDTIVIVKERSISRDEALCAFLNSFVFDWQLRLRFGGSGGVGALDHAKMHEAAVPSPGVAENLLVGCVCQLNLANELFAPAWIDLARVTSMGRAWKHLWALTTHERVRIRCIVDAVVAVLYGLSDDDFRWILRDCDYPKNQLANKAFCRTLDSKGFWRINKDQDPELRHTVLSLVAFDALDALIAEHNGDRDAGIAGFSALNNGEGWMLPETLRLADHGLGHDEQAKEARPVASRMGPRFLEWQLAQSPEESWAECERHARAILGDDEFERRFGANAGASAPTPVTKPEPPPQKGGKKGKKVSDRQGNLF